MDFRDLAARQAAEEELIQAGDPRAQRTATRILAAQQRLVRLQAAGAQEVFERVLEGGSHFAFLSPSCSPGWAVSSVFASLQSWRLPGGRPFSRGGRWCGSRRAATIN